ncbi:hypothetical protein EK21DRAFT_83899 [Setomelanomma holmii]|uniref:Uncharacterized protein n=1 Tax=Setomelanomma holmii TaxID=210430 RepID=A0A9P4LT23_9PLEO|nr:hypothetical protein EK21DRAFT_83899 [Setomelanomma holmii]
MHKTASQAVIRSTYGDRARELPVGMCIHQEAGAPYLFRARARYRVNIPCIFRLPPELRDNIYQYALDETHGHSGDSIVFESRKICAKPNTKGKGFLPPMSGVNKEIYHEVAQHYLRSRHFVLQNVGDAAGFFLWLRTIERGYENVRKLDLVNFSFVSPAPVHLLLLTRCINLVELSLHKVRNEPEITSAFDYQAFDYPRKTYNNKQGMPQDPRREKTLQIFANLRQLNHLEWVQASGDYYETDVQIFSRLRKLYGRRVEVRIFGDVEWKWSDEAPEQGTTDIHAILAPFCFDRAPLPYTNWSSLGATRGGGPMSYCGT